MSLMTKQITVTVTNISKTKDKKYIFETYENILNSILDFTSITSNVSFEKDKDYFKIDFMMKISKTGDILWILIKEFLSCIKETEDQVQITIDEVEQNGIGMTYKLYRYTPCCHSIQ